MLIALGAVGAILTACAAPAAESGAEATASAPPDAACPAEGELSYVCGPQNAEDLVRIGSTSWLIGSNFDGDDVVGAGVLYLIEATTHTYEEFFPGDEPVLAVDEQLFPDCPSIDLESFAVHGMSIRETGAGTFRLYATTHGNVEAIQAWEVDATGERPTITWVGCVPLPDDVWANSVVMLADGGFFTTKYLDLDDDDPFGPIGRGEVNGGVYEWHPGGEVTALAGTELSGANGIEISTDERMLFVAAEGTREIVRFDLGADPVTAERTKLEIAPDNLRWTSAGTLLTVGANIVQNTGWTVVEIDPDSLGASDIADFGADIALQNASTALAVDGEVWIGTWEGDRIGRFAAP